MKVLLAVSKEKRTLEIVSRAASSLGYSVVLSETGCLSHLPTNLPVAGILLDQDAGTNNRQFLQEMEDLSSHFPRAFCILVYSEASPSALIDALHSGCQVCLQKPLQRELLSASISALARKGESRGGVGGKHSLRHCAEIEIDLEHSVASVGANMLPLTKAEFTLLEVLTRNVGKPVRHETLGNALWGWDSDAYLSHLKCHISRLRTKLVEAACSTKIVSYRGRGYSILPPSGGSEAAIQPPQDSEFTRQKGFLAQATEKP